MKGLIIENLTVGYEKKEILKNLNLSLGPTETLVLMGPSGSGKTTFLLSLLGILSPSSGTITLNGKMVSSLPIEERNIGYLPQDYGLFPHLNVEENICFGLKMRGIEKRKQKEIADKMLTLVELMGYQKRKVKELSGGEKQRVGLARALAISPSILLLDEPLSNIDQVTKVEVAEELKNLFKKLDIPIILVTHNPQEAKFFAQKLAILINGSLEQMGDYDEMLVNPKTEFIRKLLQFSF